MSEKKDYVEEIPARELPLSTVENTPPLMLDLPDGQQLVVGKLPDGIVIEIATWRGTGRPDSRTNRMMLGVSYDEDDDVDETPKRALLKKLKREPEASNAVVVPTVEPMPEISSVESAPETSTPVDVQAEILPAVEILPIQESILSEINPEKDDEIPTSSVAVMLEPEVEELLVLENEEPEAENIQEEVIASLATEEVPVFGLSGPVDTRRNMQDLMGARPRAQLEEEPRTPLIERGHEIVRRPSKKRKEIDFNFHKLIKPLSTIALSSFGLFLLLGPAGVKFTLPEGGLRTSMSSAGNALVIVRESDDYQVGDSVVASVQAPDSPDYFASIAAQSDVEYVLTENNLYHTALREDVKGKVLLVMPGIGFLLHKVGL